MLDDPIKYGLLAALAIALLIAAFTDLKSRRIANWLNGAIALGAPIFWWASEMKLWQDVAVQVGLGVATFLGLSILFALRAMGGGDVKLLTALAFWIAPAHFLNLLVMMALLGGILTLICGGWHVIRKRAQMKLKVKAMSSESKASAYIVGALPFIVFGMIYWINPDYIGGFFVDERLMVTGLGALVWMSIGGFIMAKMVSFEI